MNSNVITEIDVQHSTNASDQTFDTDNIKYQRIQIHQIIQK